MAKLGKCKRKIKLSPEAIEAEKLEDRARDKKLFKDVQSAARPLIAWVNRHRWSFSHGIAEVAVEGLARVLDTHLDIIEQTTWKD